VVGETDWVPEVALLPLQAPEAVQEVALVEDQLRVELEPEDIEVGLAVRESVGGVGPPVEPGNGGAVVLCAKEVLLKLFTPVSPPHEPT
jgi:hypothetical protein